MVGNGIILALIFAWVEVEATMHTACISESDPTVEDRWKTERAEIVVIVEEVVRVRYRRLVGTVVGIWHTTRIKGRQISLFEWEWIPIHAARVSWKRIRGPVIFLEDVTEWDDGSVEYSYGWTCDEEQRKDIQRAVQAMLAAEYGDKGVRTTWKDAEAK